MKTVLVVEDSEDDWAIMELATQRAHIPYQCHVAKSGEDAIAYLQGNGAFADRSRHPVPDLVFLDIKLLGLDGHDVLSWIRSQACYRNLPVIMLTGSDRTQDIKRAYELGATSYFMKVFNFQEFGDNLKTALAYWLELNVLPAPTRFG